MTMDAPVKAQGVRDAMSTLRKMEVVDAGSVVVLIWKRTNDAAGDE